MHLHAGGNGFVAGQRVSGDRKIHINIYITYDNNVGHNNLAPKIVASTLDKPTKNSINPGQGPDSI
jgi:hypothetical protein